MAGFSLIKDPNVTEFKKLRVASQAYTKGDAVMLDRTADAVDVVPATSSSTTYNIYAVAVETVASSATECLFAIITPEQTWVTDGANASVLNDNYERMALSNKSVVNNTHTDSGAKEAVFMQTGYQGALSDNRLVGKFLKANITV